MHYTQIVLNPARRRTIEIMNDVYKQHKFIMSGFENYDKETLGRVLYRMECADQRGLRAIVQSVNPPTYNVELRRSRFVSTIESKEVLFAGRSEPMFADGSAYGFRLRANTVVTRDGKRIGLINEKPLRDWFERRASEIGVSLRGYDVIDEGYMRGDKAGKEIIFKIARYEGILAIQDGRKFSSVFTSGFGHAKGFGCGLISLARM